jgi:hypothetical protein
MPQWQWRWRDAESDASSEAEAEAEVFGVSAYSCSYEKDEVSGANRLPVRLIVPWLPFFKMGPL